MGFVNPGQVENSGSGTFAALNGAVTVSLPTASTIAFTITGTWIATLTFEATTDGTTWFPVLATVPSTGVSGSTTTANGSFVAGTGGYQSFRIRASSYTSGTVSVSYNADTTPNVQASGQIKGATDGTGIGNVGDRLKTDNVISAITGAVSASFSSKTRVDLVTTPVNLVTGSYTTCYSYSGTGLLLGLSAEFNNSASLFRLQVDGENILTAQTIATLGGFQATSNTTDRRQNGQGVIINGANIDISFRQPIRFTSNVTIAADAGGGVILTRQMSQALVYIVKET